MKALERSLGLGAVISVSISAMLGSGIFVLPGLAFGQTGPSAWAAYFLAAFCVLPTAISKSELATAMPTSGGTYVYIERTFGPLAGTIAGLGLWLSLLLKSAFALIGIGAYLGTFSDLPVMPSAITLLIFIVVLNLTGVGKVSKVIMTVVLLCISGLGGLSFFGVLNHNPEYMRPFMNQGLSGFLSATAFVFISFAGVTKVAAIAEEVKKPEVNLPRGILLSLLIVTVLYSLVAYVLAGNIPMAVLDGNLIPIHTLAVSLGGNFFGIGLSILAVLTMASMANAGLLAASRFPFAMSRDFLLPGFLGRLHEKLLTPIWSILFSGAIIALALIIFDVAKIAKLASAFILILFMFVNLCVIVLREARVQWYKPKYKSPLYPWVQLFGIFSYLFLLFTMQKIVVLAILVVVVPGVILYFLYSQKRTDRRGVVGIRGVRRDLTQETESEEEDPFLRRVEFIDLSDDANVVVALFGKEKSPEVLIEMGAALAEGGKLEVTHLTEVPEQTTLSDFYEETPQIRALRRRINALGGKQELAVRFDPVVSHDITKTIHQISSRLHCRWLVNEWGGKGRGTFTVHNPMGWLKDHLSCHLATFRDTGVRYIRKVMVVSKGEDDDRLILSTADHFAKVHEASLTIVKVLGPQLRKEEEEAASMVLKALGDSYCSTYVSTLILKSEKPVEAIVSAAVEFDLLVIGGSPTQDTIIERFFGNQEDRIISRAPCSVVNIQPSRLLLQ